MQHEGFTVDVRLTWGNKRSPKGLQWLTVESSGYVLKRYKASFAKAKRW